MRCSNCGATLPPTSQFCNSCGTQQAAAPVAAPTATPYAQPAVPYARAPQRSGNRAGLWVAVLIGFLALAAGATVVGKKLWSASRNPTQLAQGQDPEARDFQQLPAGPGVQVPDGSGVTGASGQRPPKGGDVTGAKQSGPGYPQSPLLAPSQLRDGGNVTGQPPGFISASKPQNLTGFPSELLPQGRNPLLQPGVNPPAGNPTAAQPKADPLNTPAARAQFDNYLAWLRKVELGGQILGDQIAAEASGLSLGQLDGLLAGDEDFGEQRMLNSANMLVVRVDKATKDYLVQVQRSVPPVPPDCVLLHRGFMALTASQVGGMGVTAKMFADGMTRALRSDRQGALRVVGNLKAKLRITENQHSNAVNALNFELKRICEDRKVPVRFEFKSANSAGISNGLFGGLGL